MSPRDRRWYVLPVSFPQGSSYFFLQQPVSWPTEAEVLHANVDSQASVDGSYQPYAARPFVAFAWRDDTRKDGSDSRDGRTVSPARSEPQAPRCPARSS